MTNITAPVNLSQPSLLDPKLCNFYVLGANVVIETIPQYLHRVSILNRVANTIIVILVPKDGFTASSSYPATMWESVLSNFIGKYYIFKDGLKDENFTELILSGHSEYSIQGDGTPSNKFKLKGDVATPNKNQYYGTDDNKNLSYHNLPEGGGGGSFDITDGTITKTIDNEDTVHFKAGSGIEITVNEDTEDSTKKEVEIKTTGGIGSKEPPELFLDFEEEGDEFVYNVPYKMKFVSQNNESTNPVLSIPLNTVMDEFDKLTVTATAGGLVRLYGEYVE